LNVKKWFPDFRINVYGETALLEMWQEIHNTGGEVCQIGRVDSFFFDFPSSGAELLSFY
jgi:hypothetical protein